MSLQWNSGQLWSHRCGRAFMIYKLTRVCAQCNSKSSTPYVTSAPCMAIIQSVSCCQVPEVFHGSHCPDNMNPHQHRSTLTWEKASRKQYTTSRCIEYCIELSCTLSDAQNYCLSMCALATFSVARAGNYTDDVCHCVIIYESTCVDRVYVYVQAKYSSAGSDFGQVSGTRSKSTGLTDTIG